MIRESEDGNWARGGYADYLLIGFPFAPFRLLGGSNQLNEHEGSSYVEWMKSLEPERARYLSGFLAMAGSPVVDPELMVSNLEEFTDWLVHWFPEAFSVWRGLPQESHWWIDHYGNGAGYWYPGQEGYSPKAAHFEISVAHDVAFLVAKAARSRRPELGWAMSTIELTSEIPNDPRYHLPVLNPDHPGLIPTLEVHNVLRRSLTSATSRQFRDQTMELEGLVNRICS